MKSMNSDWQMEMVGQDDNYSVENLPVCLGFWARQTPKSLLEDTETSDHCKGVSLVGLGWLAGHGFE